MNICKLHLYQVWASIWPKIEQLWLCVHSGHHKLFSVPSDIRCKSLSILSWTLPLFLITSLSLCTRDCSFLSHSIILSFNLYQRTQKSRSPNKIPGSIARRSIAQNSLITRYRLWLFVLLGCHTEWGRYNSDSRINIKVDRMQGEKLFIFSNALIQWLRWTLRSFFLWKLSGSKFRWCRRFIWRCSTRLKKSRQRTLFAADLSSNSQCLLEGVIY